MTRLAELGIELALSDLNTNDTSTDMVCEVWEDGEVTLTKGGDLYRQRNLHSIEPPFPKALALSVMPRSNGKHGCLIVPFENYKKVRAIIAEYLGVEDPYK